MKHNEILMVLETYYNIFLLNRDYILNSRGDVGRLKKIIIKGGGVIGDYLGW